MLKSKGSLFEFHVFQKATGIFDDKHSLKFSFPQCFVLLRCSAVVRKHVQRYKSTLLTSV